MCVCECVITVSMCLSVSACLSVRVCLSLCLCLCVCVCFVLSVYQPVFACVFVYASVGLSVSVCLLVCVCMCVVRVRRDLLPAELLWLRAAETGCFNREERECMTKSGDMLYNPEMSP